VNFKKYPEVRPGRKKKDRKLKGGKQERGGFAISKVGKEEGRVDKNAQTTQTPLFPGPPNGAIRRLRNDQIGLRARRGGLLEGEKVAKKRRSTTREHEGGMMESAELKGGTRKKHKRREGLFEKRREKKSRALKARKGKLGRKEGGPRNLGKMIGKRGKKKASNDLAKFTRTRVDRGLGNLARQGVGHEHHRERKNEKFKILSAGFG